PTARHALVAAIPAGGSDIPRLASILHGQIIYEEDSESHSPLLSADPSTTACSV
ncbi:hypothetical protein M378DRAFT_154881, partial [Amanita muscaria Koide BX008]